MISQRSPLSGRILSLITLSSLNCKKIDGVADRDLAFFLFFDERHSEIDERNAAQIFDSVRLSPSTFVPNRANVDIEDAGLETFS